MKGVLSLATLLFLLHIAPVLASSRALLIGIDDYKSLPPASTKGSFTDLKGSINDVRVMKKVLIERFGFLPSQVKVLENSQATRHNIKEAFFDFLVRGTRPGDVALFYFSGHGSQVPDDNGDEGDGKDEVLCPYDIVPNGGLHIILDDTFGQWLRRLAGRTVVIMVDSCHSGGMTRSVSYRHIITLEPTPSTRARYLPITNYHPSRARGRPPVPDIPRGVIFLTASREDQAALEVTLPQGWYGGFTYGVYQGLMHLARPTYAKVYRYAEKVIKDRLELPQEPVIEARPARLENMVALRAAPPPHKHNTPLPPNHQVKVQAKPETHPSPPPQALEQPAPSPVTPSAHTPPAPSPPAPQSSPLPMVSPPMPEEVNVYVAVESITGATALEMRRLAEYLARLEHVQLVSADAFFDRLLRGRKEGGRFHVHMINRVGDVEEISCVSDIEALITAIKPLLNKVFMAKLLARLKNPGSSLNVSLRVVDDRGREGCRDFFLGDHVAFRIKANRDCHLILLAQDTEGAVYILYPNRYHRDNRLQADREITIPAPGMPFRLQLCPPAGKEIVKAIATVEPLDLAAMGIEAFQGVFGQVREPVRSIKVIGDILSEPESQWGEDTVVLRSHRKRRYKP